MPDRIGFEATGNYHRVLMYHLGVAGGHAQHKPARLRNLPKTGPVVQTPRQPSPDPAQRPR
jgi:hypothetical protein